MASCTLNVPRLLLPLFSSVYIYVYYFTFLWSFMYNLMIPGTHLLAHL